MLINIRLKGNKNMKKIISMILILMTISVFAGVVEPFKQFTQTDFTDTMRSEQPWNSARLFTLSVKANTTVWLSNYVKSFYEPIPDLHGNVFNMGEKKYGYIYKNDLTSLDIEKGNYDSLIHWANGETNKITYTYSPNPSITNTATGYILDEFKEDADIYLVMTALDIDGGETVDTYQYVQDINHDTTLLSRQHNTFDLADNVRINFGINDGREFVAVYNKTDGGYSPSGQPLPGLMFAGILSLGTVFGVSKIRRHF